MKMKMKAVGMISRCSQSRVVMDLALMQGATGMHFAAKRGDVKFVRILREAGALPLKNAAGHTPIDVARRFYGDAIPPLLEEALLVPVVATSPSSSPLPTLLNGASSAHFHGRTAVEKVDHQKIGHEKEAEDNDLAIRDEFDDKVPEISVHLAPRRVSL